MTQIDTSKWGGFKVGDLFDVTNGKKYPSSIRQTGELPLISTTANNNGISDYIKDRNDGVYSNCITVAYSGSVGATFYHKEKVFVGETVIALLPKFKMNQYSGLFICSILSKINSKFSYTQKIKVLQYKNEAISLPVTSEGAPDFDYMENYMKEITKLAAKRVEKLKEEKPQTKIDTNTWKKFKVGELFECNIAKSLDFGKLEKGNTIFIGRTSTNNGVQGEVNASPCEKGNCITVSMVGDNRAFYQSKEFAASQNILILRNKRLNEKNGLFFAALINSLLAKYNYSNTVKKKEFISETIPLPVTPEGTPDFDYMENYMKKLTEKAKKKFSDIPQ